MRPCCYTRKGSRCQSTSAQAPPRNAAWAGAEAHHLRPPNEPWHHRPGAKPLCDGGGGRPRRCRRRRRRDPGSLRGHRRLLADHGPGPHRGSNREELPRNRRWCGTHGRPYATAGAWPWPRDSMAADCCSNARRPYGGSLSGEAYCCIGTPAAAGARDRIPDYLGGRVQNFGSCSCLRVPPRVVEHTADRRGVLDGCRALWHTVRNRRGSQTDGADLRWELPHSIFCGSSLDVQVVTASIFAHFLDACPKPRAMCLTPVVHQVPWCKALLHMEPSDRRHGMDAGRW
mmetsp:Transcript_6361/g.17091  ORF Transcript_6361/g.17091 Transcript_6361/m.17091 type:complete len:286 (+) Transcript_6361:72-929(+)